jgi:hypothetical protein
MSDKEEQVENIEEICEEVKAEPTTKENYKELKATIDSLTKDFEKFDTKKVKAAGQRVRNHLLNAKKLCDVLRKQLMCEMRDLPTKHRIVSEPAVESSKDEIKEEEQPKTEAESEQKPKPKRTRKANVKKVKTEPKTD